MDNQEFTIYTSENSLEKCELLKSKLEDNTIEAALNQS